MSLASFSLPFFSGHRSPVAAEPPKLSKSNSHASFLAPLAGFARRPAALFEYLLEELTPLPTPESVAQQELENRRAVCSLNLQQATTFSEWQAAAAELDLVEGNNAWKKTAESPDYDYGIVQAKLDELDQARLSCNPQRMCFLIRTSLTRHLGRMGNVSLYKRSHIGTKYLIERYIASALDTITALLDSTRRSGESGLDSRLLLDQIVLARQAFGRSALLLSGGGTFGMNHIGVVKSLWEANLLPRIISGASAGSIVCSVLCAKTDEELPAVLEDFCTGDLDVFTRGEGDDSFLSQLSRFLKHGALFDIGNLTRVMKNLLGNLTFQEAYNRTRRILNICVSSAGLYDLPRLLNYVTAPNVIIWSAVAASCSVPLVFQPSPLLAKDPRTGEPVPWNVSPQSWIDGSVDNDLPMTRLAELFNVNHFIVSQVNPHVVPFLVKEETGVFANPAQQSSIQGAEPGWLHALSGLAKDEAMHRMHVLSELGVLPTILTKVRSILSQRYSGDITILPELSYAELANVLRNPSPAFMLHATAAGERATWPKLARIQNHCAIELALDDAVQRLRARIAFSTSQVNLRALAMAGPPARAAAADAHARRRKRPRATANMARPVPRARHRSDSSPPLLDLGDGDDNGGDYSSEDDGLAHAAGPATPSGQWFSHATRRASPPLTRRSLVPLPPPPAPSSAAKLFPHASQPATPLGAPPGLGAGSYFFVGPDSAASSRLGSPTQSRVALAPLSRAGRGGQQRLSRSSSVKSNG